MSGGLGRRLAAGAAIAGFAVAGLLVVVLFQLVGWLAIAVVGLLVLLSSVWLDLLGGHDIPDHSPVGEAVNLLAIQVAQMDRALPEQRLAMAAERESRRRHRYIARTVGLALTAAGIGMFLPHQM